MGRRSRKRGAHAPVANPPTRAPAPAAPPTPRRGRRDRPETPPAPWGTFPLAELTVLAGLGLVVTGFLTSGRQGTVLIVSGFALASVAGLEVSLREHLAGVRSHSSVLAGAVTVAVLAALIAAHVGRIVLVPMAVVVFAAGFLALRGLYQRRTRGLRVR